MFTIIKTLFQVLLLGKTGLREMEGIEEMGVDVS